MEPRADYLPLCVGWGTGKKRNVCFKCFLPLFLQVIEKEFRKKTQNNID